MPTRVSGVENDDPRSKIAEPGWLEKMPATPKKTPKSRASREPRGQGIKSQNLVKRKDQTPKKPKKRAPKDQVSRKRKSQSLKDQVSNRSKSQEPEKRKKQAPKRQVTKKSKSRAPEKPTS